jgi:uncharacterized Zn-binding protein involved in type VI secretion
MRGVARLGDRTFGTCYHPSHNPPKKVGGEITTASSDDLTNNRGTARLGDSILSDCGHPSEIVTGSSSVMVDFRGVARIGDLGSGVYKCEIITGSENRFAS